MNILIIGSNGFVGSSLIKYLSFDNYKIYSASKSDSKINYKNVTHLNINFQNQMEIEKLSSFYFDVVIVAIWSNINSDSKNNLENQFSNIDIYYNILKYFSVHKPQKIIIIGSTMEFSSFSLINENSRRLGSNAYGLVKLIIRDLANYFKNLYKLNIIYVVSTSIIGKGRKDNNIIDYTLSELNKENLPIFDNLNKNWSFLHIDDFCFMIKRLSLEYNSYDEYYLSSDNCTSLKTLIKVIYSKKGLAYNPSSKNSELTYCSCCDLTRYFKDYGPYRFKSFEDIIEELI